MLCNIDIDKCLLDKASEADNYRKKIDKWESIRQKGFCTAK